MKSERVLPEETTTLKCRRYVISLTILVTNPQLILKAILFQYIFSCYQMAYLDGEWRGFPGQKLGSKKYLHNS